MNRYSKSHHKLIKRFYLNKKMQKNLLIFLMKDICSFLLDAKQTLNYAKYILTIQISIVNVLFMATLQLRIKTLYFSNNAMNIKLTSFYYYIKNYSRLNYFFIKKSNRSFIKAQNYFLASLFFLIQRILEKTRKMHLFDELRQIIYTPTHHYYIVSYVTL
jgi:hypothetical protein